MSRSIRTKQSFFSFSVVGACPASVKQVDSPMPAGVWQDDAGEGAARVDWGNAVLRSARAQAVFHAHCTGYRPTAA